MQTSDKGKLPPLGITMGCPVGIGPEIILRFLTQAGPQLVTDHGVTPQRSKNHGISGHRVPQVAAHPEGISFARTDKLPSSAISGTAMRTFVREPDRSPQDVVSCDRLLQLARWPVVIGDAGVLRRCAATLGMAIRVVDWQPGAPCQPQALNVLSLSDLGGTLVWGKPTGETGRAMGRYIEEAARLVRQGQLAGLVTCPISKAALKAGGYRFPGHTEMLAELCQAKDFAMMMAGARLKVTLVSIHQPLAEVPAAITRESVLRMITITGRALRDDFGVPEPRLAVAGLNPHAGEEGMFGDEEQRIIAPAVAAGRRAGWLVEGPFPPDTVFHKAAAGQFDAVVAMYHDQGLIPFKLLHFSDGVNVTLGLPVVRTSVDHGTAYDIAGQGLADPASLAAAVSLAEAIVANRKRQM